MHPVFWGAYIVTFVFWVGIAHAGTLISAILYLFRAKWRNAINRSAEAMTVFAVLTAAQFLGIHVGRIWKSYFILPYPNQRGLWVNFKSPLLWDTFAISTYATISIVFLYVGLIPDLAIARDRATGWRKLLYTALSLGWQGTSRQWKAHNRTVLHLSGLATPLVLSVHSVVSWDFAMSIVPGLARHDLRALLRGRRHLLGLRHGADGDDPGAAHLRPRGVHHRLPLREHVARFLLLTSIIVGYAYADRVLHRLVQRRRAEKSRAPSGCAFGPVLDLDLDHDHLQRGLPTDLLWFKKLRTNIPFLFVLSVLINIGMWFERYVIIITASRASTTRRSGASTRRAGPSSSSWRVASASSASVLPALPEGSSRWSRSRGEGARDPREGSHGGEGH